MLGLPEFFSATEREIARESAERDYPDIIAILDGRVEATPANMKLARRWFREDTTEWLVHRWIEANADGVVIVEAVMGDYWGKNPPDDMENQRHVMLVPQASSTPT